MKNWQKTLIFFIIIMVSGFWATPALAIRAGDLKELKIFDHFFTTQINGEAGEGSCKRWVVDPNKKRILILKVQAKGPQKNYVLWSNDFILRHPYRKIDVHKGCVGIAKSDKAGSLGFFQLDCSDRIPIEEMGGGEIYFALAFFVPNDIEAVSLDFLGSEKSITYSLSGQRKYSIYMTTKKASGRLSSARTLLEQGGYQVVTSSAFAGKEKDLIIWYMPKAETAAREVSQRFMSKYNTVAILKEMELFTAKDIVIWIGSDVFHDI